MFAKQKALQKIVEKKNANKHLYKAEKFEGERINLITQAIIHEGVELQRETNWKWFKNKKDMDLKKTKEEAVDILFFFIMLCLELNITPDELYLLYLEKHKENIRRQEDGY